VSRFIIIFCFWEDSEPGMRIEQLTFTRFIAAIAIVIYHYGTDVFPFRLPYLAYIFKAADVGVSYFFILSGFVMIIAYGDKPRVNTAQYFKNRAARIYPVYLVALLLVTGYYMLRGWSVDSNALGLNLLVLQAWLPPYPLSLNYPGWSLAVELFFYALFPLLFNRFYTKASLKKVVAIVFVIWAVSQMVFLFLLHSNFYKGFPSESNDFLFYFPVLHLNQFLVGNVAGLVFKRYSSQPKNYDVWLVALVIILAALLRLPNPRIFHDGLLALLFIPFIYLVCLNTGVITSFFRSKPLVFFGEISYGIYILQYPAFLLAKDFVDFFHLQSKTVAFAVFLLFLLLMASLSYLIIEVPLRNKIKRMGAVRAT